MGTDNCNLQPGSTPELVFNLLILIPSMEGQGVGEGGKVPVP